MTSEHHEYLQSLDRVRKEHGFLGLQEMMDLLAQSNSILDPHSTLISAGVSLGHNNVFYPGVIIECKNFGQVRVGNSNIFHLGTFLLADQGMIQIGDFNEFGDGGVSLKANRRASQIEISDRVRLVRGMQALGRCCFGAGSQVIGAVTVQDCVLGPGDSYEGEDPDRRGGLLKGFGLARGLKVPTGCVIEGTGSFRQEDCVAQTANHPRK